ncbi:MAG: hypothetical protein ACRCWF_12225 [Beijerinckiaceae bacterium]
MDTGLNVRPVQAQSFAPVRVQPAPERQVVRTELPEEQSVQAVAKTEAVAFDDKDKQSQLRAQIGSAIDNRTVENSKKVDRDAVTQELVFRTVSSTTGRVVSQFPDEAILRQRAYAVQQRRDELDAAREVKQEQNLEKVA